MANRNSLADKLENINKCDICYAEYNRYDKQPVIICSMHHTVCRECMQGLEATRKCPFCRENINFSKVVVNNYLFQLLPNQPPPPGYRPPPPNTRVIAPQQPPAPPLPHSAYPPASVNYQAPQPVYPQNYYPPPPEQELHYIPPFPQQLDNMQDEPLHLDNCVDSIEQRLRLNIESDRKGIYVVVFIMQLPYLIFDLYFSLASNDKECMDTPYVTRAYVVRPWLFAMGITEASIMFLLFFGALLRVCNFISYSCLKSFEYAVIVSLVIKILLWLYMELALFSAVIAPHCSGGVYAYGLIQTIIHGILLLIMCCVSTCK